MKELNQEQIETLIYELIQFFKKWGMFDSITFYANDCVYSDSLALDYYDRKYLIDNNFKGIKGIVKIKNPWEQKHNPIAITIESTAYWFFNNLVYEVDWNVLKLPVKKLLVENSEISEFEYFSKEEMLEAAQKSDELFEEMVDECFYGRKFLGNIKIFDLIHNEFCSILGKYGLWYDQEDGCTIRCNY